MGISQFSEDTTVQTQKFKICNANKKIFATSIHREIQKISFKKIHAQKEAKMFYRPSYSYSFPLERFFEPEMRMVPVCRPQAPFKRPHFDSLDQLFDGMFSISNRPNYRSTMNCRPKVNQKICRREPSETSQLTPATPKNIKPLQSFRNIDPSKVNVSIDQKNNTLTIDYEKSGNGSYQKMTETRSLPKFIAEQGLHQQIQCKFEQGQVNIILPEMKAMVEQPEKDNQVADETVAVTVTEPEATEKSEKQKDEDSSSESSADLIAIETEKEFH